MADIRENDIIEPEDAENTPPTAPLSRASNTLPQDDAALAAPVSDAEAEVPVPVVMEPAEIDERAQVIEALRKSQE